MSQTSSCTSGIELGGKEVHRRTFYDFLASLFDTSLDSDLEEL
jgi:hypothetical protein